AVLTQPHWDALSPDAPLRHWRMVEPEPGGPLTQAGLRIDERILHFLTGVWATDAALAGVAQLVNPSSAIDDEDLQLAKRIARLLALDDRRGPIVALQGREHDAAARRDFALATAAQLERPVLWMEAHDLPADAESLALLAIHVDRETALSGALPVLSMDGLGGDSGALGLAARLHSALLWLGAAHPGLSALAQGCRLLRCDLPTLDAARTRSALRRRWERVVPPGAREDAAIHAALDRAARQFH